jgi:hypothetical protein
MLTSLDPQIAQILRKAAIQATRAPSVHNTQPWRLTLTPGGLQLGVDWTRRLRVLDPTGRQLLISCGCALFNARVSAEHSGYRLAVVPAVDAMLGSSSPGSDAPIADLSIAGPVVGISPIGGLDALIELRQTNRRRFSDESVDDSLIELLTRAAADEGALLVHVRHLEQRLAIARLTQHADRDQNGDPAYRAELRAWTSTDPGRLDGVPAEAVPHVGAQTHDDIPIRDFDSSGAGGLPGNTESSVRQCVLVLATEEDTPAAWLSAGQALERVWLEATRNGYTMSLFTQPIEVAWIREALRAELQMSAQPHMVIRIGRAPRTPATRRRRLVEVITESP